jgi:hypothetical protein
VTEMKRYAFIPSDYRAPVVLGWLGPQGFLGDRPHGTEGFLVRVKTSHDTPTQPPPKGET